MMNCSLSGVGWRTRIACARCSAARGGRARDGCREAAMRPFTSSLWTLVWYGMVNVDLYSAIITKVSNALNTLVSGEKPSFQTLSEGLVVLLCSEVVRQGVPDHGAVHSECSASNSG